jgi:hypothetical protein
MYIHIYIHIYIYIYIYTYVNNYLDRFICSYLTLILYMFYTYFIQVGHYQNQPDISSYFYILYMLYNKLRGHPMVRVKVRTLYLHIERMSCNERY